MGGNRQEHAIKNEGHTDCSMEHRNLFSIVINSVIVFAEVLRGLVSDSLSLHSHAQKTIYAHLSADRSFNYAVLEPEFNGCRTNDLLGYGVNGNGGVVW